MDDIGISFASSAQLKRVETSDFGSFWVKMGCFSTFWWFSMKLLDSERVLRHVTMAVGAGGSVSGWDLKKACDMALSLCPVRDGVNGVVDELALVESVGGCKITSLGVA